ncbi:MAG: 8-oxoguanine deaminase [Candidatus Marinimicrobia bacterium]|nr:8-oxoguanine deaminase [Candidatus Neomarinimicrobiota bacterium]
MSRILIQNPLAVATMNDSKEEFTGGHILIEDDKIASIGPETLDIHADEVIDASQMAVLPGFINTHHHLYQSLTRNIPLMQNQSLFNWLVNHYEVWRELTEEAVSVSAKTGLLELMKSGTTTSSDHLYLFPNHVSGKLIDAEIQSASDVGIRFQPTRGSMSLGRSKGGLPPDDTVQTEAEIQTDVERLVAQYHDESEGAMVRISLAPCSPFSVTPELMKSTVKYALANDLQMHTHLAETLDEESFCIKEFGARPAKYVDELGWMNSNTWFAHAIHLSDDEIERMAETGVGISHCPTSNMRLGSGIARITEMVDAGVRVSLGVDGTASNDSGNMLMEIRNAMLLSRLRDESFWLTARDVLWMATRGGASVLGRKDIGQLSVGKQADIALFSMDRLEYAGGLSDPIAALVFSVRTAPVDNLIINGSIQIMNGKSAIDEKALIDSHNLIANVMVQNAQQKTGLKLL